MDVLGQIEEGNLENSDPLRKRSSLSGSFSVPQKVSQVMNIPQQLSFELNGLDLTLRGGHHGNPEEHEQMKKVCKKGGICLGLPLCCASLFCCGLVLVAIPTFVLFWFQAFKTNLVTFTLIDFDSNTNEFVGSCDLYITGFGKGNNDLANCGLTGFSALSEEDISDFDIFDCDSIRATLGSFGNLSDVLCSLAETDNSGAVFTSGVNFIIGGLAVATCFMCQQVCHGEDKEKKEQRKKAHLEKKLARKEAKAEKGAARHGIPTATAIAIDAEEVKANDLRGGDCGDGEDAEKIEKFKAFAKKMTFTGFICGIMILAILFLTLGAIPLILAAVGKEKMLSTVYAGGLLLNVDVPNTITPSGTYNFLNVVGGSDLDTFLDTYFKLAYSQLALAGGMFVCLICAACAGFGLVKKMVTEAPQVEQSGEMKGTIA